MYEGRCPVPYALGPPPSEEIFPRNLKFLFPVFWDCSSWEFQSTLKIFPKKDKGIVQSFLLDRKIFLVPAFLFAAIKVGSTSLEGPHCKAPQTYEQPLRISYSQI